MKKMISYKGTTGDIQAYLSVPESGNHLPGIIVIHDIFGLSAHTKDVADRFSRMGYAAMAPHLYSGDDKLRTALTAENISAAMRFMQTIPVQKMRDTNFVETRLKGNGTLQKTFNLLFRKMPKDALTKDLVDAVRFLDSQEYIKKGRIASIGFCFGGGMSINLACHTGLAGCILFYGENPSPIELVKNINCPVLGIYGAEDIRISSEVHRLVKEMADNKMDFEMRIYAGASHAFFNNTSSSTYRKESAEDAWNRSLRFLERTIKD